METNENNLIDEINNGNTAKKNNKKIILLTGILVLIVVTVIIVFIAIGLFKSKGEKFVELLTKDQYLVEMIEDRVGDFNVDGETNYNLALKKKFLATIDSTFALLGNDLNLNANILRQGKTIDAKAFLKLGTFELQSLEFIKENNVVALSVPNLFENFIAINDNNTIDVAQKLGYLEEVEKAPDEELKTVLKKYSKILINSINEYITVQENVELTLNEKQLNTKEYLLSLGEKELTQIEIKILEKLKDDDETIEFILNYNAERLGNPSKETLKEEITILYNQLVEDLNNITSDENVLKIKLNVIDNKTIQTSIFIDKTTIVLNTFVNNQKDNINLNLNIDGTVLKLEYTGEKKKENYESLVLLKAAGESITVLEFNIEKVGNSQKQPRKINELNALLLNEATEEELESLRKEIEKNLGISEEEATNATIYDEGEFKLENPEARINILESSLKAYNDLAIGMSKEDAIKIMGEPSASFEVNERENMGWYYDETNSIYYISLELTDGKISKIYNDIVSSMEDNIQISLELGTEIEDLTKLVNTLEYGMTKNDVIETLGDKYLEISKDEEGYKTYKWYDKRENIIIIEFNNEDKVTYVDTVTMDI